MPRKYKIENLTEIVQKSKTWADVCRELGIKPATGAQTHIKKVCKEFGIDFSHFIGHIFSKGQKFSRKA